MAQERIIAGDYEFDVRITGKPENPAIVFLHGFPETSIMWEGVMQVLAHEGYYCIAPDLRGYSEKACPKGVEHYKMESLWSDVLRIADALKIEKFHLVGHDWGSFIGWNLVYNHPERINSWSSLSIPHSKAFANAIKNDPIQKKKSRYIGFFLIPRIPEFFLKIQNMKRLRKLWKRSGQKEQKKYIEVFSRPGTLTAALNYYRANIGKGKRSELGEIDVPTLFIWGKQDLAIGRIAAEGNTKYMKGDYQFLELEAGHWLVQQKFAEVVLALENHVKRNS